MEGATGRQRVPGFFFNTHQLLLPPIDIQQKIIDILGNINETIEITKNQIDCLIKIQNGVSNDILLGKKRVKIIS